MLKFTYSSANYDDYGILLTDTAEWNDFLRSPQFKDFLNVAVTVVFLTVQGLWSYEHINPMYLDFETRPSYSSFDQKGRTYIAAMMAFSIYCSLTIIKNITLKLLLAQLKNIEMYALRTI